MLHSPLSDWLADVAGADIVICPDDISVEANDNLRCFALTPEQLPAMLVSELEAFANRVIESRREWLLRHESHSMFLYWWHDQQAGQLRFSMVSAAHGCLPFACAVVPANNFGDIAREWLGSPYLFGIPLESFESNENSEPSAYTLTVWSLHLP